MKNKVPNLDCEPDSDIRAFVKEYKDCSQEKAEDLVGKRPHALLYTTRLVVYAETILQAKALRGKGEPGYEALERKCDALYEALPPDLRW